MCIVEDSTIEDVSKFIMAKYSIAPFFMLCCSHCVHQVTLAVIGYGWLAITM